MTATHDAAPDWTRDDLTDREIASFRMQMRPMIACRLIPSISALPLEHVRAPAWILDVARETIARFHAEHPDGLPVMATDAAAVVEHYCQLGVRSFDAALADRFTLTPTREHRP